MSCSCVRAGGVVDLAVADGLLLELQDERDRLAREHRLLTLNVSILDPLEIRSRADAVLGLIEQIENFVSDVYVRLARKAEATGDAELAFRLERATRNILAASRGARPLGDTYSDGRAAVRDSLATLGVVGVGIGTVVALVVAAVVAIKVL